MSSKKTGKHAVVAIGCPNVEGAHMDFSLVDGRYICNHCQDDFTIELKNIYYQLMKNFAN